MKRPKHLDFIRSLPCFICGDNTSVEAIHVRYADARVGKPETGMGRKPDDRWTLPLCGRHHRLQHTMNERKFWMANGIDPIFWCKALFRISGDRETAEKIILGKDLTGLQLTRYGKHEKGDTND